MKKSLITVALAASAIGMALTATSVQAQARAQESSGFYVGTGIGYSVNQLENDNVYSTNGTEKRTDTGFKLYGGYQFNNYWAIEAQYVKIGTYAADTKKLVNNDHATVKVSGVSVAAVGILPLGESFSLFGKAGVIAKTLDTVAYDDRRTYRSNGKTTETGLLLGVGSEFKLTPNLALRAEYEYFGKTNIADSRSKNLQMRNDMISIGARYTF